MNMTLAGKRRFPGKARAPSTSEVADELRGLPHAQVPRTMTATLTASWHSHRFPGANTAVPIANQDQAQFEFAKKFLQDNQLTVDIFAISPAEKETNAPVRSEIGRPNSRRLRRRRRI